MITARVKEIIGRIMRELGSAEDPGAVERRLQADFVRAGYGAEEVEEAVAFLLRMLGESGSAVSGPALRVLGRGESLRLTPEARDWLMARHWRGELGREVLEAVLGRVEEAEGFVDLAAVRRWVAEFGGSGALADGTWH